MLKDIRSLMLTGASFSTCTEFDFFNPHEGDKVKIVKGALIYGRNGTGKSTVARAFRKIAGEEVPAITDTSLYDDNGQPITLSEIEKKHIFVFDEDFVDKNVRLKQDHLETIVMLGQAADLTDKIEKAESERDKAQIAFDMQDAKYKEYCDAMNPKSPKYYIFQLRNVLRGDDNWAGRDREIHDARQNTGVRDDTYKKFASLTPAKNKTELITDYKDKLKELQDARTGASTINRAVPMLPKIYDTYNDQHIKALLEEKIEKPELSEREKKLFALVQASKSSELAERIRMFKDIKTVECPYCYQSVSLEYKKSLVDSIEKVLSKVVEEHQIELRSQVFEELVIDIQDYAKLKNHQECVKLIDKINSDIRYNNDNLKKKLDNPYKPIIRDVSLVEQNINHLKSGLEILEKEREEFNKAAKKTIPIISALNQINSEIAYYDVADLVKQLERQQRDYETAKGQFEQRKRELEEKKKVVEELEAQRRNIRLALDTINACMKYIFFTDTRLSIEFVDGAYKLLSHGKSVKPCDVSVGERNIIGLSYFFTSILEGKDENKAYMEEYLIIVDDPVSSYDAENRIGIMSFLKYKLGMFLEANTSTKALVMTHDLLTFYDIHKVFEEIIDTCKQKGYPKAPKFNRFEMKDNTLCPFYYKNRQEYTEMVKIIFRYASGNTKQYELIIGNMMRQVLEAFSTFEYKMSIEAVSTNNQILGLLREPEYKAYYKNLMYRLILHGGSHREEQVKAMKDYNFFSLISETEKVRTAKDVLCFIYLLNRQHLLEHLKECGNNTETTLQTWCQDIKARSAII